MEHKFYLMHMLEFAKATQEIGGATFNTATLKLETPADGFWVGGLKPTVTIREDEFTVWTLRDAVESMGDVRYVGTWTHDGYIYVDASEWVSDAGEALRIAQERGELAVWNIADDSELSA